MSQSASGDRNTQILVTQSNNVVITVNGQRAIELEVRPYPRPLPDKWNEIDLLKAAHAQIPFLGRDPILQEFIHWCDGPPAVSFRTLVNQGGAGKTRFAYELYARVKALPNWSAYFLHLHENSAKGVDLWSEIKSENAFHDAGLAAEGQNAYVEAIRAVLPEVPEYPSVYVGLAVGLLRDYFSKAEAANIETDGALVEETMKVLGPYVGNRGE